MLLYQLNEFHFCLRSLPQALPFLGFFIVPQINSGLPQIINVLSYDWAQPGYQYAIPGTGGGLEYLGLHFCNEYGPIRTFKDRGIDGLSDFQLSKNLF